MQQLAGVVVQAPAAHLLDQVGHRAVAGERGRVAFALLVLGMALGQEQCVGDAQMVEQGAGFAPAAFVGLALCDERLRGAVQHGRGRAAAQMLGRHAWARQGGQFAERVGYPVLIKATAGGGGKGMREVHDPAELESHYKAARAEAKANGYDVKILRQVIRIRKQDKSEREEMEALLDLYMQALGMGYGRVQE